MRQEAWLQSAPPEFGSSRREWIARNHGAEKAASFEVQPGPLEWLCDMVADAGFVRRDFTMGGAAYSSLGWREIKDWMDCTGQGDISPTFLRSMIRLSAATAYQVQSSSDVGCQVPFDPAAG